MDVREILKTFSIRKNFDFMAYMFVIWKMKIKWVSFL